MAKHILIVDDCVEMCEEVSEILADEGYGVDMAHDGAEGISLLSLNEYDAVILDLKMPGLNGFDVLRDIRRKKNPVKVIVVTAHPVKGDLSKSEGGLDEEEYETLKFADCVINKPYDLGRLVGTIEEMIGKASG